jgi:anti-sigma B factor antagonist
MWESSNSNGVIEIKVDVASLDASNANDAKAYFKGLDLEGAERAVLDLQSVSFIDSSGIGAVLSFYKQMNQKLTLKNPTPTVLSVLELLRLHRVFEIESG